MRLSRRFCTRLTVAVIALSSAGCRDEVGDVRPPPGPDDASAQRIDRTLPTTDTGQLEDIPPAVDRGNDVQQPVDRGGVVDARVDSGVRDVPMAVDVPMTIDTGTLIDRPAPVDTPPTDTPPLDIPRVDSGPSTGRAGIGHGLSTAVIPDRRVSCGMNPPDARVTAGAADRYVLRGRVITPTEVLAPGEVFITGGTLTCVARSCAGRTGYDGATVIETGGIIHPGLVNTHDHPQYNFLPPWTAQPRRFDNSDQWQGVPEYRTLTQPLRENESMHTCAMSKWGEIRSIVSGTTTIQGSLNRVCLTRTLARNIEYPNDFGGVDRHRPNTLGIATVSAADAVGIRADMDSGDLTAYILHLSEGINETSRREFDMLVARNMLAPALVVIHGTAFGANEFRAFGMARAKLVWSPRSNMVLYGSTTDIGLALDNNVTVALAPDWTPSGSPNLQSELRYAQYISREAMRGRLTARDLFEMATSRAATAVDRTQVGSLVEGRYADVVVIPDRGCDAYQSVIDVPTADTRLVILGGRPLYGDAALMSALPAAAQARCEPVTFCGQSKRICVALAQTDNELNRTLAEIETELRTFTTPYPLVPLCP